MKERKEVIGFRQSEETCNGYRRFTLRIEPMTYRNALVELGEYVGMSDADYYQKRLLAVRKHHGGDTYLDHHACVSGEIEVSWQGNIGETEWYAPKVEFPLRDAAVSLWSKLARKIDSCEPKPEAVLTMLRTIGAVEVAYVSELHNFMEVQQQSRQVPVTV